VSDSAAVQRFATNLRAFRTRAGMSQEALGFECGLHRTEISRLERGGREPRLTTIVKLADALSIDPCELIAIKPSSRSTWN